jgi:RHS repeat-associated protein
MVMAPNGAQGKVARPRLKAVGTGNACATASRSAPKTPRRTTAPSEQYIMGQYYCWNRVYDVNVGRWTTPDPVTTPWWNLSDYSWASPTTRSDTTGLFSIRIRESLGGQESTDSEDILRDAMKKLTGVDVDKESNADEDDIVEGLENTGEDDVFVYYGHSADTDGDGKPDTVMEHDSLAGCVAGGAAIGGLLGGPLGGLVGGAIGAAVSANDPIDKDDFAKAAKKAKGTVIIFGCKGCDLKFENAKCVICYEEEPTLRKAAADMEAMAKVIDDMKAGQCKTWSQIAHAATQAGGQKVGAVKGGDAATLKASAGCANVKVCE